MSSNNRFVVLDSLRGIAAVVVMLYHYLYSYHLEFGFEKSPLLDFRYGFFGVQLFFIISGFVIYFSISNSKSVRDFITKRFIRLFPTYWLCIVATFIIVSYFGLSPERTVSAKHALVNFSMLQGVFHVKSVDSSYWSLQIELFFYFFISIIFMFKLGRYLNQILIVWLACIFLYNFVYKVPGFGLLLNLQYGMFFIAGIAFYKINVLKEINFFNHLVILCSYIAAITVLKHMNGYLGALTVVYIVFYLAIYGKLSFLENKLMLFLGKISYALYLVHHHIGLVILQQLKIMGFNNPIVVVIPVAVSVFLGWIITDYFDKYVSYWLRNKFIGKKMAVINVG